MKALALVLLALTLAAAPVGATEPKITAVYKFDALSVTLEGSYPGAQYRVLRSDGAGVGFLPITDAILCTGECSAFDRFVRAGATYQYRFDLSWGDGTTLTVGPVSVTVPNPPVGAIMRPSPCRTCSSIELTLPGTRLTDPEAFAELRVLDVRGRTVRVVASGMYLRGTTHLGWGGLDAAGRSVRAGTYFLRVTSPLGSSVTKFVKL